MSRFKHYARSLVSGYALLGANMIYTLASVPLGLKYLTLPEFGLWGLVSQLAALAMQFDLGMGASVARILIDHKDDRANGGYGSTIKAGLLVGAVQGGLVLITGASTIWFLAGWLRVSLELSDSFFWLVAGQIFVSAAAFLTRIFGQVLFAWQRMDLQNYAQMVQVGVMLAGMWIGFALGWGVFSLLAGSVAGWICSTSLCAAACVRSGFWPKAGEWGRVSKQQFRQLFHYGSDLFLIALGTFIIMSSQVMLVSRALGADAVAVWFVATKAFTLLSQILIRIIGSATPAFAEMIARRESGRLWERYRGLFVTVTVMGSVCAVMFAALNGPFIRIWTGRDWPWPPLNDALLGAWMLVLIHQCCHNSLIMCLKEVREIKYAYLVEGVVFIVAALIVLPRAGMTGMLICSLCCTLSFTWAIGVWRISRLTPENRKGSLWDWHLPFLRVLVLLVPCWLVLAWALQGSSAWVQLFCLGGGLGVAGIAVAIGFALPRELSAELLSKLPQPFQRAASVVTRRFLRRGYSSL